MNITAADVNKLRTITGAGMMDCKKALVEANGDFDAAIDLLRKKGQKVAANRSDREASEGLILAKSVDGGKRGVIIVLNCETDFVAKNEAFGEVANSILETAIASQPATLEDLKALKYAGTDQTIGDKITEEIGKIAKSLKKLVKSVKKLSFQTMVWLTLRKYMHTTTPATNWQLSLASTKQPVTIWPKTWLCK